MPNDNASGVLGNTIGVMFSPSCGDVLVGVNGAIGPVQNNRWPIPYESLAIYDVSAVDKV